MCKAIKLNIFVWVLMLLIPTSSRAETLSTGNGSATETSLKQTIGDRSNPVRERIKALNDWEKMNRQSSNHQLDTEFWQRLLEDDECRVAVRAAGILAKGESYSSFSNLQKYIQVAPKTSAERSCRAQAIKFLAYVPTEEAGALIASLIRDPDEFIRMDAMETLNDWKFNRMNIWSEKMEFLETELLNTEWGPHSSWAAAVLWSIVLEGYPGNPEQALALLKKTAQDGKSLKSKEIKAQLENFCSQGKRQYCL